MKRLVLVTGVVLSYEIRWLGSARDGLEILLGTARGKSEDGIAFYDAESVERLSIWNITVRTKTGTEKWRSSGCGARRKSYTAPIRSYPIEGVTNLE
jgi:hypothetical protein